MKKTPIYVDLFQGEIVHAAGSGMTGISYSDNVVELRPRGRPAVDVLIDHIDGEWPKLDAKGRRTLIKYLAKLFADLHWADDDDE